jgi:oxygen-independent coproporphyrinogen III oxidase
MQKAPRSAYVHVPFCRRRCGYCNFTLIAGRDDLIAGYLEALERELDGLGEPREVDTLFLGGGTPSHLPAESLKALLAIVQEWFPLAAQAEFSVEANPLDLKADQCEVLRSAGVNRISLGIQSFSDRKLELLERDHHKVDIAEAIQNAKEIVRPGGSVSLDLIFGAPGETAEEWQTDLQYAVAEAPDHLSTYGLTFEKGTSFWNRQRHGGLAAIAEDDELRLYEMAIDTLSKAGFQHYEVSNFAKPGRACRHNEAYWAGMPYFAVGPGAARYVDGKREVNHRSTTTWMRRVLAGQSPVAESEELGDEDRARERLVIGLRRMRGVNGTEFAVETGFSIELLGGAELQWLLAQRWLEWDAGTLRLTRKGLVVSDSIWSRLLRR